MQLSQWSNNRVLLQGRRSHIVMHLVLHRHISSNPILMDNWHHLSLPHMHRFGHGQMYVADAVEAHSCMH